MQAVIDEYKRKIQDKIKGNVNNELCGDGKPVLKFKIDLLPSGELSGSPKLTKTSGIEACDDAVERAIMASQPLPLPEDVALKSQFRNLNLTFTPNN
ncbi:MAG: energy transducer TonB [Methylotenera sp.]